MNPNHPRIPRYWGRSIDGRPVPLHDREVDSRNDFIDFQQDKKLRAVARLNGDREQFVKMRDAHAEKRDEHAAHVCRLDEEIARLNALVAKTEGQIEKELSK